MSAVKRMFRWQNPPARRHQMGRRPVYENEVARLQAHPGQWALLAYYPTAGSASSVAYRIRIGQQAAFRGGRYDATTRSEGKGRHGLYVRCKDGAQ